MAVFAKGRRVFEEGIDLLSRAATLQPGNPDAIYNLGNVFKDAERWNEAIFVAEDSYLRVGIQKH